MLPILSVLVRTTTSSEAPSGGSSEAGAESRACLAASNSFLSISASSYKNIINLVTETCHDVLLTKFYYILICYNLVLHNLRSY